MIRIHIILWKMLSQSCEVKQANGSMCDREAKYHADDTYLCALHAHYRHVKEPRYLIGSREQSPGAASGAHGDDSKLELTGLLSNSAICRFEYRGITFRTAQAAYEAMKFYYNHENPATSRALYEHVYKISMATDLSEVRRLADDRSVPIRPDWRSHGPITLGADVSDIGFYSIRDRFMFDVLERKFTSDSRARSELLATGDKKLLDNSPSGDYWSNIHGKNRLGELLMMIRLELQSNR